MLSPFEVSQRKRHIANAIASQRLEGQDVDPETIADLYRIANGEIQIADAIRSIKERTQAGQYRRLLK